MKLYGNPFSTCTRKVLMTLAEKGHEVEFVPIDFRTKQQKSPEHLKRQPFGVVPALEDDGFSMYESRAIIRYVDRKLSGPSLTPADPRGAARMEQWMSVEQCYFSGPALDIIQNRHFCKARGEQGDEQVALEGVAAVARPLDVIDEALASSPFLAGKELTLADITWMPYVDYLFPSGEGALVTSRKNVAAWWERVSSRPAWKKVTKRP